MYKTHQYLDPAKLAEFVLGKFIITEITMNLNRYILSLCILMHTVS